MNVTSELHDTHKQKEQRNRKEKRRRPPSEGAQAKTQNRKTVLRHGGALDDGSYVRQVGRDHVGPGPEQDPALVPCFGHRPLMGAVARSTVGVYGTLERFMNRSKHAARPLHRNHTEE